MPYISRSLEKIVLEVTKEYPVVVVTGPRQVGKTTMLQKLMEDTDRGYVSLDDLNERNLAKTDPELFLQLHKPPVLIDEVQYAPELFTYIKIYADKKRSKGDFWLTGSQAFKLMQGMQESLAGRVAVLSLTSLSQAEIYGNRVEPFVLDMKKLPGIFLDAALSTATVMLIMCGAKVFSHYLSWERIPHAMTAGIMHIAKNKYTFLLFANILLLMLGMFMDAMPCMIIIAPLLAPIAQAFGINMIHFGIMMCLNSAIGAITPPFGNYIFQTAGILKIKTQLLYKELVPFVVVCLIVLFMVTYIPWLATIVPTLVYGAC